MRLLVGKFTDRGLKGGNGTGENKPIVIDLQNIKNKYSRLHNSEELETRRPENNFELDDVFFNGEMKGKSGRDVRLMR